MSEGTRNTQDLLATYLKVRTWVLVAAALLIAVSLVINDKPDWWIALDCCGLVSIGYYLGKGSRHAR